MYYKRKIMFDQFVSQNNVEYNIKNYRMCVMQHFRLSERYQFKSGHSDMFTEKIDKMAHLPQNPKPIMGARGNMTRCLHLIFYDVFGTNIIVEYTQVQAFYVLSHDIHKNLNKFLIT